MHLFISFLKAALAFILIFYIHFYIRRYSVITKLHCVCFDVEIRMEKDVINFSA